MDLEVVGQLELDGVDHRGRSGQVSEGHGRTLARPGLTALHGRTRRTRVQLLGNFLTCTYQQNTILIHIVQQTSIDPWSIYADTRKHVF